MFKVIKASIKIKETDEMKETIEKLYLNDKMNYQLPMIYFDLMTFNKCSHVELTETHIKYNDCLLYYFRGILKMLNDDFDGAEFDLEKSFYLSSVLKEKRQCIIQQLSLVYFLNQKEHDLLNKMLPPYLKPTGIYEKLWDLDKDYAENEYDDFLKYFKDKIKQERIRRIVYDLAIYTKQISLEQFLSKCGVKSIEDVNISPDELEIIKTNDVVKFGGLYLTKKICDNIAKIKLEMKE